MLTGWILSFHPLWICFSLISFKPLSLCRQFRPLPWQRAACGKRETGMWKRESTLNRSNAWLQGSHLANYIKKLSPVGGKEASPRRGQGDSSPCFLFLSVVSWLTVIVINWVLARGHRSFQCGSVFGFWLCNTVGRALSLPLSDTTGVTGSYVSPNKDHITQERHCFLHPAPSMCLWT